MNVSKKLYADSMAFLDLQGKPPIFESLKRPQLSLVHLTSVPPTDQNYDAALAAHLAFREQALSNPGVHKILVRADLDRSESMGILFGMQHSPENMTLARLWRLRNEGIRSMGLAYDKPTEYGDGFKGDGRLTGSGMQLIEGMAETGILLDLSHAGRTTVENALDFIRIRHLPMNPMMSHSGCYSMFPHPRNAYDDTIECLADTLNGYIGIPAITFFLARKGCDYLEAFTRHIKHASDVCDGRSSIGIGSDCIHRNMTMGQAETHFGNMTKMLSTNGSFGEYFPDRPPRLIEQGSWMFDILEESLLEKFSAVEVEGFCGQNFRSFLKRSLPRE